MSKVLIYISFELPNEFLLLVSKSQKTNENNSASGLYFDEDGSYKDQEIRVDPSFPFSGAEKDQIILSDSEEEDESRGKVGRISDESDSDEFEDQNEGDLL